MRQRLALRSLALGVLVVLSGCTVDSSFVDTNLYLCATDAECGEGWGCTRAQPLAPDFCAPLCGDGRACDGECTGGDTPTCLRACRINEDGTASSCPGDDFECIRTSAERPDGVCYPVKVCQTAEDCGPGERCLSDSFRQTPGSRFRFDRLYCQPMALANQSCPGGYKRLGDLEFDAACVAPCDVGSPACPPASGCLLAIERQSLFGPFCTQSYGVSCQSDANCFVGRCRDTGTEQGKLCTPTCAEANVSFGGCGEINMGFLADILELQCDPAAPSDDGSGLCSIHYLIGRTCLAGDSGAAPCVDQLMCKDFRFGLPGNTVDASLCSKACLENADCLTPHTPVDPRIVYVCDRGYCFREGVIGEPI